MDLFELSVEVLVLFLHAFISLLLLLFFVLFLFGFLLLSLLFTFIVELANLLLDLFFLGFAVLRGSDSGLLSLLKFFLFRFFFILTAFLLELNVLLMSGERLFDFHCSLFSLL